MVLEPAICCRFRRFGRPSRGRLASALCTLSLIAFCAAIGLASDLAPRDARPRVRADEATIQGIVDHLKVLIPIVEPIKVSIVDANPRVVSVQSAADPRGPFVLAVERGFLEDLTEDDLRAMVAHELGHVWIFTHHPYLQTEQLANQIAMRIVSRENLEHLYQKLWKRTGATGDLARVLGRD